VNANGIDRGVREKGLVYGHASGNGSLAVDVQHQPTAPPRRREKAEDGLDRHPRQAARRYRPCRSTMTKCWRGCRRRWNRGGRGSRRHAAGCSVERPIGVPGRKDRLGNELARCEGGCWKEDGMTVRKEFWVDWGLISSSARLQFDR